MRHPFRRDRVKHQISISSVYQMQAQMPGKITIFSCSCFKNLVNTYNAHYSTVELGSNPEIIFIKPQDIYIHSCRFMKIIPGFRLFLSNFNCAIIAHYRDANPVNTHTHTYIYIYMYIYMCILCYILQHILCNIYY